MDGDSEKYKYKNLKSISGMGNDDRSVFQSTRFRRSSILVDTNNWKFVGGEFRFVLYCGIILWTIHIVSTLV
jgi:hypothetical protein